MEINQNYCIVKAKEKSHIIKELDEFGFVKKGRVKKSDEYIVFDSISGNGKIYYSLSETQLQKFKNDPLTIEVWYDCGTDVNLFLAIAALRTGTDKKQWFIHKDGEHYFKVMHYCYLATEYIYFGDEELDVKDFHKMDKNELIEFFGKIFRWERREIFFSDAEIAKALEYICYIVCNNISKIKILPDYAYADFKNNTFLWKELKNKLILCGWNNKDVVDVINHLKENKLKEIYDLSKACMRVLL